MHPKLKVLQVIPKLGYGGAETGCYDIAHYLHENDCKSFLICNGGELTKFIDKSFAGPLLRKEINAIDLIVHKNKNPVTCIIGGSKISTKINVIINLIKKINNLIIFF